MTAVRIIQVDPYRVDAYLYGELAVYAIADQFGWALMAKVWKPEKRDVPAGYRTETVARVDYGSTRRRNARVAERLLAVVVPEFARRTDPAALAFSLDLDSG